MYVHVAQTFGSLHMASQQCTCAHTSYTVPCLIRIFQGCDGSLMNTIINFGDSLEKKVLSTAEEHAKRNDLMLCLGSSLRVTPACDLVEMGQEPLRLAICNRYGMGIVSRRQRP